MTSISRRKFIITAGAAAAGTVIANSYSHNTAVAQGAAPEVTKARLGFIALTDSAPLIIAKEKKLFDKYGMTEVEVLKQASWGTTRDNIELGSGGGGIDGAHILSPMPYLISLGKVTKQPVPMYILARLNVNGQGIVMSNAYKDFKIGLKGDALKQALAKAKADGKKDLKVAVTFPGGTHDLWMRYWLAANGVNPDKDVSTIVVPPPQMVANIKIGTMESFCVGEPWPAQTVNQDIGYMALTTGELWKDHPEKSFAMRADWVDKNPKATQALLMAVIEAQQWCDNPANTKEMCEILSKREWLKAPVKDILGPMQGKFNYGNGRVEDFSKTLMMKFWRDNASYPYKSHDTWFLIEDMRWGYVPTDLNIKATVDKVNREDLWKQAAKALKVPDAQIPKTSSRGVEKFFDGVTFNPEKPQDYLKGLKIKKA